MSGSMMCSLLKVGCRSTLSILAIIVINVAGLTAGQECGGDLSDSGSLSLANISSPYPRNCTWNLAATTGQAVNLQLTTFSTQEFGNLLQIYSGDVVVFEYATLLQPTNLSLSSTAKVVLLIQTGQDFVFSASFTSADPACSQAFLFTQRSVWTPNFPQSYTQPFNCTWEVELVNLPGLYYNLIDFTVVNEKAVLGSLGLSTSLFGEIITSSTTVDGVPQPPVLTVLGGSASISFNGNGCRMGLLAQANGTALGLDKNSDCVNATGFLAEISPRSVSSCNANITGQGRFSTPNFPASYPRVSSCVFVLTASPGLSVSLTFNTFNVAYPYDSVRLYNDGVFAGRYTGAYDPFTKVLGSVVTVEFISNWYNPASAGGFNASFNSV